MRRSIRIGTTFVLVGLMSTLLTAPQRPRPDTTAAHGPALPTLRLGPDELDSPAHVLVAYRRMMIAKITSLSGDSSGLLPVGDLDGDGGTDLIRMRYEFGQNDLVLVLAGLRGRDGRELWQYRVDSTAVPVPMRIAGGDGVLVATMDTLGITREVFANPEASVGAGAFVDTLRLTGLRGNGTAAWQRAYPGGVASVTTGQQSSVVATGLAWVAGPMGSSHVLVGIIDAVSAAGTFRRSATAAVVDGATGLEVSRGLDPAKNALNNPMPVGDLTGDGRADYAFLTTNFDDPAAGYVTGHDSVTGLRLWRSGDLPVTPNYPLAENATEVTGDRANDVLVNTDIEPPSGANAMHLVDGATGRVHWSKPGVTGFGSGVGKVAVHSVSGDPYGEAEITVTAHIDVYDTAGNRVYPARQYTARASAVGANDRYPRVLAAPVGDVGPDGLRDPFLAVSARTRHCTDRGCTLIAEQQRSVVLDGRSGGPQADLPQFAYPLGGTLDGAGDDLAYVSATTIIGVDGQAGTVLWQANVGSGEAAVEPRGIGDATGDGRVDVLFTAENYATGEIERGVLDGATGTVLWRQ